MSLFRTGAQESARPAKALGCGAKEFMIRTWSVTDGGALCECGHLRAMHCEGTRTCQVCAKIFDYGPGCVCLAFRSRTAEDSVMAPRIDNTRLSGAE